MPVKIDETDDEAVTNDRMEEDSDQEVFSFKRNKTSRIKSDGSDEDEINGDNNLNKNEGNKNENLDETSSSSKTLENGNFDQHRNSQESTETEFQLDHDRNSVSSGTNSSYNTQKKDFKQLFSNRDLYDPEDSDDDNIITSVRTEVPERSNNYDAEGSSDENEKPKFTKEKSKPQKAKKSVKNKEKKKEIDEIHSETQRLIRRSRVSLPYHKPRQRTLAEFLQRRPSIPTKSIRMSSDELKLLAKQVEKRAKEAEEFYKSSSDEEQAKKSDPVKEVRNEEQLSNTYPSISNPDVGSGELAVKELAVKDGIDILNKISDSVEANLETEHPLKPEDMSKSYDDSMNITVSAHRPIKANSYNDAADSNDLNLKNKLSEECENNEGQNCQPVDSNKISNNMIEISQSDVESGNLKGAFGAFDSTKFKTHVPFCDDEIDSQDLCLRIEDTETFDAVNEKKQELTTQEQSLSDAIKNIVNSEKSREELRSGKTSLNDTSEEMSSQELCLRIEDSEPFETVSEDQKESTSAKQFMFSECVPKIMTTKDYEKSALQRNKSSESVMANQEVDSQNQSEIQNLEILDTVDVKSKEVQNETFFSNAAECALRNEDKNLAINNNKSFVSEESKSKNIDLYVNNSDSIGLMNSHRNKMDSASECVTSSRKNLSKYFLESMKQVGNNCISNSKENFDDQRTDNLKLLLEGEETILSLNNDQSTMMSRKTSEKFRSEETDILNNEDHEVSSKLFMESNEENSKIWEKKKELARKSYDSLNFVKDSQFESEENVLNAIQKLRGNESDNTKNSKLLRTMSLLEDRLKSTRKSLKLQKAIPQLKGSPSKVIDLDDTPSTGDINTLKQRFLRHSLPKIAVPPKSSVEISVVSAEKGPSGEFEVKKEIVTVESETENLVGSRTKLLKLKEELQRQIVKEREEEWNKRQLELKEANTEEKSECGMFDDDDEEIVESDDAYSEDEDSEENEEDEEEEDDDDEDEFRKKRTNKKNKKTCAYVDDEAEVSDGNTCDESDDGEDNVISEHLEDTIVHLGPSKENQNDRNCEAEASITPFKRMKTVDPFESQEAVEAKETLTSAKEIKRSEDQSQSQDTDGDIELESSLSIPPYQPGGAVSQISDPVGEEPFINILPPTLPTPLRKRETETENFFSPFPQSSASFSDLDNQNFLNENDGDEAELLGLCSGKFSSQLPEISQDESINSNSVLTSTLCLENKFDQLEPTEVEHIVSSAKPTIQSTKLLKSKEEKFLASTDNVLTEKEVIHEKNTSATQRKKYVVVSSSSSDDDDDDEKSKNRLQRKLHKKLQFSDDEDENEEEKISKKSDGNSDSDDADDPEEPQELEYDSEENEIVKSSAAKDFFENEAELSESEWGSADEDEKGLDDFELEEGDDEMLDQNKVRSQLEKMHMRRVLDEDQQEIKRLQELLLEDGEFHSEGGGRQRQFRWKNLNDADDLQSLKTTDDFAPYDGDEEEEDESEWRRMRFEREVFLQEHKKTLEKDEELLNAVKLKFKSPLVVPKKPGQVKRGSFLTRSEAALARIALITKNSTEVNVSGPTNSRNFVFTTLSQDPKVDDKQGIKRKAMNVEVSVSKRTCARGSLLDQLG